MVDPILGISRVSSQFQVTIPKDVRDKFNLKEGDRIVFREDDGILILEKA